MEWLEVISRWTLGLQLVLWGLNGFFHWIKIPPSPPVIEEFVQACMKTRFIMPTVKILEILLGALLVSGFAPALALVFLTPILFVICGLHLFNNPKPWAPVLPILIPFVVQIYCHWMLLRQAGEVLF